MDSASSKKKTTSNTEKISSPHETFKDNETDLVGSENSDPVNLDAEATRPDPQVEDRIKPSVDGAENEINDEMNTEEGEKAGIADNYIENVVMAETNGDNTDADQNTEEYDEAAQNTDEYDEADDQEYLMWEDDEDNYQEDATEEDEVSGEEATEEDEEKDAENGEEEVATEDEKDDEYGEEEVASAERKYVENEEEDEVTEEDTDEENDDDEVATEGDEEETDEEEEPTDEENDEEIDNEEEGMEGEDNEENIGEEKERENGDEVEGQEQNTEKIEVITKNVEKSKGKLKQKVKPGRPKKVDSKINPASIGKGKVKKKVKSMGMIFMCSSKTKNDCYKYRILGLPESKKAVVEKIYTGMRLFLYDVDLKLMYGIYKAAGPGGYNIEPKAFKSQFPAQVRFTVLDNCLALPEEKFKKVIKDNYFTKNKFDCVLKSEQVKKLCKLFIATSKGHGSKKLERRGKSRTEHPTREERNLRRRVAKERRPAPRKEPRYLGGRVSEERRPAPRKEPRYLNGPRKRARKVLIPATTSRDELRYLDRPLKRQRKVTAALEPIRRPMPASRKSPVPSYAYERSLDVESYRRASYLETRDPFRDVSDPLLDSHGLYRGRRDAPRERIDRSRDEPNNDLYLERRDPYRDAWDSYLERRDPLREGRDSYLESRDLLRDRRDTYLDRRDSYRDARDSYAGSRDPDPYRERRVGILESRVPYRDGRDEYLESRNPYRDERDARTSYLENRGLFRDNPLSESYSTDRRDPLSDHDIYRDRGPVYRDTYHEEELLGRRDLKPRELRTGRYRDFGTRDYASYRDGLSYSESAYSAGYQSRAGLARKYHL